MADEPVFCPFGCGYKISDGDDYQVMLLHVETIHPEDDSIVSSFLVQEGNSADMPTPSALTQDGGDSSDQREDEDYVYCTVEGCGEALLLMELESHFEMHSQEGDDRDDRDDQEDDGPLRAKRIKLNYEAEGSFAMKIPPALRNLEVMNQREDEPAGSKGTKDGASSAWRKIFHMPDTKDAGNSNPPRKGNKKLGKSELGPYWKETQMPASLVKLLMESDGKIEAVNKLDSDGNMKKVKICPNMAPGIVPVIAQLLHEDREVAYAYMCDPAVKHVSKLKKEGGFCGYRNIQMLSSYIIDAKSQGHELFNGKIPTIFDIQEYIENAWDIGINAQGKVETGGIRGTRKYIGTPDAQAMFCSLGIACNAQAFKSNKDKYKTAAYDLLFQFVEKYFADACTDFDPKVRCTTLPPIYFQHPGHSMTIIGFEKQTDSSRNIIVFDPMFHDGPQVLEYVSKQKIRHKHPEALLKAYRRGAKYLRRYSEFEVLGLTPPKQALPRSH